MAIWIVRSKGPSFRSGGLAPLDPHLAPALNVEDNQLCIKAFYPMKKLNWKLIKSMQHFDTITSSMQTFSSRSFSTQTHLTAGPTRRRTVST